STLVGTLAISASGPAFWYTLAYSTIIVLFGLKRIRRRGTPYVTVQTLTLMFVQVVPLFLLPEVILPQLNYHGLLPRGIADALFPVVDYGHGREFWRAYGLILAWPLLVIRIVGWALPPGNRVDSAFDPLFKTPYKWGVDVFLVGVIGYGLYFWFSGRVWCRFLCPLAALMHIYARFSRFAIAAD